MPPRRGLGGRAVGDLFAVHCGALGSLLGGRFGVVVGAERGGLPLGEVAAQVGDVLLGRVVQHAQRVPAQAVAVSTALQSVQQRPDAVRDHLDGAHP